MNSQIIPTMRGVVYPWHCDAMGHVATRFYTGWFDDASYHLMASVGGGKHELADQSLGWADVQSLIQYKREMMLDDLFYIESCFLKVGKKSITSLHELKRRDGVLLATQEVVTVQFHLNERRAVEILPPVKSAITRNLEYEPPEQLEQ